MSTTIENTEPQKPKQRGRKPVNVSWPGGEFTAEEVTKTLGNSLSRVSVHSKINKAVETGELMLVKKVKPKMGRPKSVYAKKP
jgi:response regulator of citrate/malate metabolism